MFRTLVPSDERSMTDFAEGWYIVKISGGQGTPSGGGSGTAGSGLGRGDDAGGLEDIARSGREKCREIWRSMKVGDATESDDE